MVAFSSPRARSNSARWSGRWNERPCGSLRFMAALLQGSRGERADRAHAAERAMEIRGEDFRGEVPRRLDPVGKVGPRAVVVVRARSGRVLESGIFGRQRAAEAHHFVPGRM